jgi:ribonuclease I
MGRRKIQGWKVSGLWPKEEEALLAEESFQTIFNNLKAFESSLWIEVKGKFACQSW